MFIIASRKYLGRSLTKDVRNIYNENNKILKVRIEDTRKLERPPKSVNQQN
jgi:hypothetical protein